MTGAGPFPHLVEWLKRHGGLAHASLDLLKIQEGPERGVVATDAIAAGTELLVVPVVAALHGNATKECARYY